MELHNNNGEVTVIIDVSFSEEIVTIKAVSYTHLTLPTTMWV